MAQISRKAPTATADMATARAAMRTGQAMPGGAQSEARIAKERLQAAMTPPQGSRQAQVQVALAQGLSAAVAAGVASGVAGRNMPLPPQPPTPIPASSTAKPDAKSGKTAYQTVDGRTVQLTPGQAAAARARRNSGNQ